MTAQEQLKALKQMKAKPNLFIVGAPKCGTTAWATYLRSHPDIAFGDEKEPHFFNKDLRWRRNTSPQQYATCFERCPSVRYIGDASVLYLYSFQAAQLIYEFNPEARILIFLRDHVGFLKSYHNQLLYLGVEDVQDLESAWELTQERQGGRHLPPDCPDTKLLDYRRMAHFYPQVKRYFDVFPSQHIHVTWLDEWKDDPRGLYLTLMRFLALDDDGRKDFPVIGRSHAPRIKWLGAFLRHPPASTLVLANLLRRCLGVRRLRIHRRLRRFNIARITPNDVSAAFRQTVARLYQTDRRDIEALMSSKCAEANVSASPR